MSVADILRNEKECVERNIAGCTRDCANCDLLLPDKDILAAYDAAIALFEQRETIKFEYKEEDQAAIDAYLRDLVGKDVDNRTTVSIHRV